MRSTPTTTLALLAVLLLAGCDNDHNWPPAGSSQIPDPDPDPTAASRAGIWQGTLTENSVVTNDITCLITADDELACLLFDPVDATLAGGANGSLTVSGMDVTGSGVAYSTPGYTLPDDSTAGAFTITGGTVVAGVSLQLDVSVGAAAAAVSFAYDALHERGSSLAAVAGTYDQFFIDDDPTSFSIDAAGTLFAQTSLGCVGNGQVSLIDPSFNIYDVEITMSNCPDLDGVYQGLGTTSDLLATDDVFQLAVATATDGIPGEPVK
jgi:hypothetical protein